MDYIYKCECGEQREISHSMNDNVTVYCYACGKEMDRKIFASGIVFKGSGWSD